MSSSTEKTALRMDVLQRRSTVSEAIRFGFAESLARIGAELVRAASGREAIVVSVFLPIRGEPETEPLIAAVVAGGAIVALPVTVARAQPLRFLVWRPGEPLEVGRYGIREPLPSAREVSPDMLFVPLAAYDRRGFRLGYGAGYYDSSLEVLRRHKTVVAVGVAFSIQEVEHVPTEPHDQRLDAVITEHGLMTFGPA